MEAVAVTCALSAHPLLLVLISVSQVLPHPGGVSF